VLGAHCYYHLGESTTIEPRSGGMDECSLPSKRNKQEMQTMSHGLSKFFRCHSCLAVSGPCRLCTGPLSMPSTLAVACTPDHYLANLALFLTWITGGIFLLVGGLLAFVRFRFRARKSDPLSGPTQVYRSSEVDLAWTVIPVPCWCYFSHEKIYRLILTNARQRVERIPKDSLAHACAS
jgi:hypothetical protein